MFFELQVQQDNNPSRSATASLLIKVKDINDNLPFFKDDYEEVHIDEHASFGTFLCKLSATDIDSVSKFIDVNLRQVKRRKILS